MKKNGFVFEVGDLVREDQGTKITFELDEKNTLDFVKEHPAVSHITGDASFMKVADGIHVHLTNLKLSLKFNCIRCLKEYMQNIDIDSAERVFYFKKQKGDIDELDIYYVDMKNMIINISDFLRQEIILHFPMIPVCSKSCKGLCAKCGKNLNEGKCNCKKTEKEEKPLAELKKLYKSK